MNKFTYQTQSTGEDLTGINVKSWKLYTSKRHPNSFATSRHVVPIYPRIRKSGRLHANVGANGEDPGHFY